MLLNAFLRSKLKNIGNNLEIKVNYSYRFPQMKNVEEIEIDTPFGKPSSPIFLGELSGRKIAFLARHGIGHVYLPSEVNYRANIFALKSIGVNRIVSVSACGSLREDFRPGHIVIPDQLMDLTHKRERTFFGEGLVAHIGAADPYCPILSQLVRESLLPTGAEIHMGGTYITIEGPRFSTKGESHVFRAWGMDIIGMTTSPEAFLAREAEMCYGVMAHITDYDVWHETEEPVHVEMLLETLAANAALAQRAIRLLVPRLATTERTCDCKDALAGALITQRDLIPEELIAKLSPIVAKYLK